MDFFPEAMEHLPARDADAIRRDKDHQDAVRLPGRWAVADHPDQ
jgi:hypothetical protein